MYGRLFSKIPVRLLAAAGACGSIIYHKIDDITQQPLIASGFNYSRRLYPASSEYPDISRNKNIMARNLNKNLYAKLRDRRTPNGFTIDDAIQTGVDNIGTFSFTGCVAGDEETYIVFRELFDKIILEKHGYKADQVHVTDLDASKIQNGEFDPDYVLSIRIKTIRNLKGYCLPTFCTRGERRDIESIIVKSLYGLENLKGTYFPLKELSTDEETALSNQGYFMHRPFHPIDTSSRIGRDWPDSRGIWLNDDRTIGAYINQKDHVVLTVTEKTNNLKSSFTKFVDFVKNFENQIRVQKWEVMHNKHLGYITTDPKNLGTALKLTVRINLPKLSEDSRLSALLKTFNLSQNYKIIGEDYSIDEPAEKQDTQHPIVEISSKVTLGKSEVEITQEFINSINKLIETEKLIASGGTLEQVLYQN